MTLRLWFGVQLCAVTLLLTGCGGDLRPPQLSVQSQVIDFGVVPASGKTLEIPIANRGAGPLSIYEVATSCACQIAEIPKSIAPGEQKNILLHVPGSKGPRSSRIIVKSNDQASPHEFYLTWLGESPPALDPPRIRIDDAKPGELIDRLVKVAFAGGDSLYALKIESLKSSDPAYGLTVVGSDLRAKHEDLPLDKHLAIVGETSLAFHCRVPDKVATMRGMCNIKVKQGNQVYQLDLPVDVQVRGSLWSNGSLFFSGRSPKDIVGKKTEVVLNVRDAKQGPIVKEKPKWANCTLKRLSESNGLRHYLLETAIVATPPAEARDCSVVLQIPGDDRSRLTIPLTVVSLQ